ncbi:biosynthetic peptidoglycan transglycosylase [Fluviispira multicolorata]|uniref:Glycosyl transferase family 51 domain-containing protein n=1 Tax=Fluviispira multicolorata TaxID=2654512 RepID=A0A833N0L4_9BACT|nr:biosynthetic peptidoglycan transglycosylase [Fluviispira multicolorata]KAB8029046.1 hypothetical protein GCL57_10925 [Fluviispira multicolorata]
MKVFSFTFCFIQLPLFCFVVFLLWFIPWVFLLYSGILMYFPYEADGNSRYIRVTGPIVGLFSNTWAEYKDIPHTCKAALIASEDNRFYQHNGVDFESLKSSFLFNQKVGKRKRGGSTITQQLVKNAFLSRNKNYLRKSRELIGAFILDGIMLKENQLEWYFNVVEFGPKVYGLENAAQKYFKIEAKKLSPSQCISLVAIIPSPRKWNQSIVNKKPTQFFVQRYNKILSTIQKMDLLSKKEILLAQNSWFGIQRVGLETNSTRKINVNGNAVKSDESTEDVDSEDDE